MTDTESVSNKYLHLAVSGVRGLSPYQPGKPISELQREYELERVIKLASNENPLGYGKLAAEAIGEAIGDLARYPDGNGFALKNTLAGKLSLDRSRITLGNGSNDVLELLARTFVSPEDEVIYSQHAFAVYPLVTQAIGARAVEVPAVEWGHDLQGFASAVTERTRMVFIANPNNPTGTWVGKNELHAFIAGLPGHVLVVVDEAYSEYIEESDYPDAMAWLDEFPNLVVCRTFSKIHGLAGLRVGYAVSHPDVADLLNRVRQPFNVNSIALAAAEAALHDDEHVRHSREVNQVGMLQLTSAFDELGLTYIPSVGNFICVDAGLPGGEVYQKLLTHGVITRPVDNYGMSAFLRVSIGLERENRRFLTALQKVLDGKSVD